MKHSLLLFSFLLLLKQYCISQSITLEPNPTNGIMVNIQNKLPQGTPPSGATNHAVTIPTVTSLPVSPQTGMMVFFSATGRLLYYNGTAWVAPEVIPSGTIVLSETKVNPALQNAGYGLKSVTNIQQNVYSLDSYGWFRALTTVNAPAPRTKHSAVWTGTQMIIWYGVSNTFLDDGKKYSPATDSWTAVSASFLVPRFQYSAVWTGSKMIVWGGETNSGFVNDGAAYDPVSDIWSTISTANSPSARGGFSALWTGDKMIIWGGYINASNLLADGKMYAASTNTWTSVSMINAPSARRYHSAVWTGSKMIVWGGETAPGTTTNTGSIYDPATDSWSAMSTVGAPPLGLSKHCSVWTGSKMVVFGGNNGSTITNACYLYTPATNTWTSANTVNKPGPRVKHTVVWTGSRIIVFGGEDLTTSYHDGGVYNPVTDTWDPDPIALSEIYQEHTAVWTGEEMIVFGSPGGYLMKKDFKSPESKTLFLYQKN